MKAELRDSLEFLYADSEVNARPCRAKSLDVARGGTAAVHVLVNGLAVGARLTARLELNGNPVPRARWFRLAAVPVEANTGPVGFIEKEGERNRFVTRRAPFNVFDAMEPMKKGTTADDPVVALRVHVPVPVSSRAGTRLYTIALACGSVARELKLTVRVHRAAIPRTGPHSFPYTNWFSLRLMAERHGLTEWSDAHWRMIQRYARLMAHGRQNTFLLPLGDIFDTRRGKPTLNRERLRRLVRVFTDAGMHYIEGGHIARRTGGDWEAATFEIALAGPRATTPEGNRALATIAGPLMEEIDRNHWRDRWIQHVTDEPTDRNAVDYRILAGMARRHFPGLPILDATMDLQLAGAVDIWCPQAQEYQHYRKGFQAQQELGDRVWFYTCCFPGGPWLNRLLDQELLRPALFGWGAARYDLDGFLHWGLNQYRPGQDPFCKSVVPHGGTNSLPAGDTHIVYPGDNAPWSSLRLESQREGLEDYELLRILKARNPAHADAIIGRAFQRFDRYTKDTGVFRAARRALLAAVSGT